MGATATGPFQPLDIYDVAGAAFFQQHQVRELQIVEQSFVHGQAPGKRLAVSVQRFDSRGNLVYELSAPREGRFFTRREWAYSAANKLTETTMYGRTEDAADTTRHGRIWLPYEHSRQASAPAGHGTFELWNPRTGDWQPAGTSHLWTSHDTTYDYVVRTRPFENTTLSRFYPSPGGLTHYDLLTLDKGRLIDQKHFYFRQDQGRQIESGMLSFEEGLGDLMARQQLPSLSSGSVAYRRALDNLARHSADRASAQATRTYNAQDQLVSLTTGTVRATLRRNAAGQVDTTWWRPSVPNSPYPTERTTYVYQPYGLVARQETADA